MTIYFDMDGTFSSPSGDGLVLRECMMIAADSAFSSPLGDGLVPNYEEVNNLIVHKFLNKSKRF